MPDPLVSEDAEEAPQMMAPHPDTSFAVLEDEEEEARKGLGTGVGVVAFDKVRRRYPLGIRCIRAPDQARATNALMIDVASRP